METRFRENEYSGGIKEMRSTDYRDVAQEKRRMQSLLIVRNILCYPKKVWQISSCKKDICMEVPY